MIRNFLAPFATVSMLVCASPVQAQQTESKFEIDPEKPLLIEGEKMANAEDLTKEKTMVSSEIPLLLEEENRGTAEDLTQEETTIPYIAIENTDNAIIKNTDVTIGLKFDAASVAPSVFLNTATNLGRLDIGSYFEFRRYFNASNTPDGDFSVGIAALSLDYKFSDTLSLNGGYSIGVVNPLNGSAPGVIQWVNLGPRWQVDDKIRITVNPSIQSDGPPQWEGPARSFARADFDLGKVQLGVGIYLGGSFEGGSPSGFAEVALSAGPGQIFAVGETAYTNVVDGVDVPADAFLKAGYRFWPARGIKIEAFWTTGQGLDTANPQAGNNLPDREGFGATAELEVFRF